MTYSEQEALRQENVRLRRAVEELSILKELATEISGTRRVDEILQTVIRRARRAAGAEEGVITLISEQEDVPMETLVRTREHTSADAGFRPDDALLGWMHSHRSALVLNDPANEGPLAATTFNRSVRSLICVPMMVGGRIIGILTLYNKTGRESFDSNDARLLTIMAAQSAQIIENAHLDEQRERVIRIFGQHTAPEIVDELLRRGQDITGRRTRVSIMFIDVRGFSSYAERSGPEEVVGYLNTLFDLTIDCVNAHRGVIHQLLGDGFMAMFGAPISHGNDSLNATRSAVAMITRVDNAVRAGAIPPTRLGIGLHAGEVIAGMVGSAVHREYKVTGDTVNVAARIEELNKTYDSRLLVSEAIYSDLDPIEFSASSLGNVRIRGRDEPVHLYRLA